MKLTNAAAVMVAIASLSSLSAAQAQDPRSRQFETSRPVQISVNYSLRIAYDPNDAEAAVKSMDVGRRSMYRILGSECELLLATIATSCHMRSASVRATPDRRRRNRHRGASADELPTISLHASAKLQVIMKPLKPTAK